MYTPRCSKAYQTYWLTLSWMDITRFVYFAYGRALLLAVRLSWRLVTPPPPQAGPLFPRRLFVVNRAPRGSDRRSGPVGAPAVVLFAVLVVMFVVMTVCYLPGLDLFR